MNSKPFFRQPPMLVKAAGLFLLVVFLTACATLSGNVVTSPPSPNVEATVDVSGGVDIPTATDGPAPVETEAASPDNTEAPPPTQPPAAETAGLGVTYVKDGNVWLWMEGESSRALTSAGNAFDARLSDDGAMVAFMTQPDEFHSELWVVNADGSNERQLVSIEDIEAFGDSILTEFTRGIAIYRFDWTPGTHTLAFNTRQTFEGPGLAVQDDVRLVNADTGEITTLLPAGQGGEFYYSPDGRQIAITTPTTLSLINADGSNRRDNVLTYEEVLTYSEYWYYARPVWAADSGSLRVAIPPADAMADTAEPTTLWQVPVDGSPAVQTGSVVTAPFFGSELTFSPDLSRILYLVEVGEPAENRREVHIANPDGSGDTVFLSGPLLAVIGWAPDSTHFVFAMGNNREMMLGHVDGSYAPLAGNPANIDQVRWIDAERFMYLQEVGGAMDLRIQTVGGGGSTVVDTITGFPVHYDFNR